MGIGDWGLGIGDWGLGIGQSPIPNINIPKNISYKLNKFIYFFYNKNLINFN